MRRGVVDCMMDDIRQLVDDHETWYTGGEGERDRQLRATPLP